MKRKGFAAETPEQRKKAEKMSPESASDQVAITLLLTGGQQYTVTVMPEDPLLHDLYETLVAGNGTAKRLFQIPIHSGRAVLAFPSDRLIGLITEPPLIIEQSAAKSDPVGVSSNPLQHDPCISKYLQLDNFLSAADHQRLLNYVIEREAEFVPTTTFTGEVNYRESVVLYSFSEFSELITQRLHQVLPQVFEQLGVAPFPVSQIEAQLTAHNDGQFYKVHNDNGSHDTATRELTYVYYFYREPKPFTGGELVIYDSAIQNNYYIQADTFKTVEPRNNSIVFFLSRYMHEVLPIHCPSQTFSDSRFTINGWIRR
jgi:Rps23 Pro-64 3,4-dihydroxylase Tpa1-like proline 4-hydroxylase